jgi:hypothetical protein
MDAHLPRAAPAPNSEIGDEGCPSRSAKCEECSAKRRWTVRRFRCRSNMLVTRAHSFILQARLAISLALVAGYTNVVAIVTCGVVAVSYTHLRAHET